MTAGRVASRSPSPTRTGPCSSKPGFQPPNSGRRRRDITAFTANKARYSGLAADAGGCRRHARGCRRHRDETRPDRATVRQPSIISTVCLPRARSSSLRPSGGMRTDWVSSWRGFRPGRAVVRIGGVTGRLAPAAVVPGSDSSRFRRAPAGRPGRRAGAARPGWGWAACPPNWQGRGCRTFVDEPVLGPAIQCWRDGAVRILGRGGRTQ